MLGGDSGEWDFGLEIASNLVLSYMRELFLRAMLGGAMLAGWSAGGAAAWGQMHKVAKPEQVVRAVGVYEWTGDMAKPTASRLIPVSISVEGKLEDAGVYVARPVPFALLSGNVYELQDAGAEKGMLELVYARHLQAENATGDMAYDDGWFGYGSVKPLAAPKKVVKLKPSKTLPVLTSSTGSTNSAGSTNSTTDTGHSQAGNKTSGDGAAGGSGSASDSANDPDRPTMKRRSSGTSGTSDDSAGSGGTASSGSTSTSTASTQGAGQSTGSTPADDPDRPTMKRRSDSSAGSEGTTDSTSSTPASTTSTSSTTSGQADDPDRPTMKRRSSDSTDSTTGGTASGGSSGSSGSSGSVPADDPDRPTLKRHSVEDAKKAKNSGNDIARASGTGSLNDDPDRPNLHHGKPTRTMTEAELPKLVGLPADLHQMVAVSDAANREPHEFALALDDATERATVLAKMEGMARAQLAAYKGFAGSSAGTAAAPLPAVKKVTAAAKSRRAAAPAAAPQVALLDEQLKAYTLSYGGAATYVFSAHTAGTGAALRYVTVVAQADGLGELKPVIQSVTDAAHMDNTPRMRLVGVVDVEASNRASLLFELRGQSSRQFGLYRVIAAHAEQVFLTGTTQ